MSLPPLNRATHRHPERPEIRVMGEMSLALARAHEIAGPARRTLALLVARALSGPVIWITPGWHGEGMNAPAMARFCDPGRFLWIATRRDEDALWTMEEVLREGSVPLVVAEMPAPPAMTPVRRLHLAAETGAGGGVTRPLGLLLTPGLGGAQGIETRWHMTEAHRPGDERWIMRRLRARTLPPKAWDVTEGREGFETRALDSRVAESA